MDQQMQVNYGSALITEKKVREGHRVPFYFEIPGTP